MQLSIILAAYTETDETTELERGLSRYRAEEEPTVPFVITKSDAIWEASERARVGNVEAQGFWLLVASAL
jgi:hypothetical protein